MSEQKPPPSLLFRVPPPSELPNFITNSAPQQQASEELIKNESQPVAASSSGEFLQSTFSAAIPPQMGAPCEAPAHGDSSSSSLITTPGSLQSAHEAMSQEQELLVVGDPMPGSGLLTWVKGAVASGGLLHRVAERAKSSVDSMITTLDPQMKEYMNSGGDLEIIVASDKEDKVSAVREAFQSVFGKATVTGYPSQSTKIAAQPVGYAPAMTSAKERIGHVRASNAASGVPPIVAIENFVVEVASERWFDVGVLALADHARGISLETYTQATPVPAAVVAAARGDTPADYEFGETGFSTTIGSYMAANLQVHHKHWHEAATGVSRREMILLAAKSLAGLYKRSVSTTTT